MKQRRRYPGASVDVSLSIYPWQPQAAGRLYQRDPPWPPP